MVKKSIGLLVKFFLIMVLCTLIASADQTNDSDKYTFDNYGGEVYTPEPMEFGANLVNGETAVMSTSSATLENGSTRKHVLIQFYDNPTDNQYEMLQNYGINYLTSAAPYTLIVSMPAELTAADLPAESGLRWMGEVPLENKYDRIYGLDVPEWAKLEDGNIQLSIRFYDDVTYQNALDTLNHYSNNITNFSYSLETSYEIVTNKNNISLLAGEDSVMYMGYAYDDTIDETEFTDSEEMIEEHVGSEAEQENDFVGDVENISDTDDKKSPGFSLITFGMFIPALMMLLRK